MLKLDTQVQRNPNLIASDLDGEKVMMSVETGSYYGLADTGGRIWELLDQPRRISEVCEALLAEYSVEPAACEQQTLTFLTQLVQEGLVQVVDN
jgi:hypothetical protein